MPNVDGGGAVEVFVYGAPASLYTAKVRAFLRARRIGFVERFPSHPRYRTVVRPAVDNHRIPAVEFPDGLILQDSTVILDEFERRWPDPAAAAMGPRQRLATHLLELAADRGLAKPAMHFRWSFPEINEAFLVGEFGRSLRFDGPPEEIDRLGRRVASKMASYLPMLGIEPHSIPAIEQAYDRHLALLNAHFARHPYLLGGAPSRADYAMMGPLFGHLGRDPLPLRMMQERAPLLFRWTERINGGEIETPEFPGRPRTPEADDAIPETLAAWLRHVFEGYADELVRSADLFNAWAEANPGVPAGGIVSADGADQPSFGPIVADYHGVRVSQQSLGHPLWLLQRVLDAAEEVTPAAREALAREIGAEAVMSIRLARRLTRVNNRLAVE